jgi:phosphorylase kinase alpha/beta subunit
MIRKNTKYLQTISYPTGLFAAAAKTETTGYNKAWIRDNIYTTLGLEAAHDIRTLIKTYHALLNIFKKHTYKIDWMIKQPQPKHAFRYIHARYNPETLEEIHEEWGNKQNDAIGAVLFKVGDLTKKGVKILRDEQDLKILQKLVDYLKAIEYWHDTDNGMWEENEEIHASSIGACVAGLKAVQDIVDVPTELIRKGEETLKTLLPRESNTKEVDLALLSLQYPYNILTKEQRTKILKNVEEKLVRERGVIRYPGDKYYNTNGEAEWTMGFPWLAIIYKIIGDEKKHQHYLAKTKQALNKQGELPELYYAKSREHNENTPLAWAMSLMTVAES